ncbi:calcium/proton exchanger [Pestalotiopsis sp. NC0098]|nr:calcium/proton exchanger [Pestalotiopsis sp. NC0098]
MASRSSARHNGGLREKSPRLSSQHNSRDTALPQHRADVENGHKRPPKKSGPVRVKPAGESGRRGLHPLHFFKIIWRSTSWLSRAVNILWPIVPAAIAVHYALPERHLLGFILAYIAMIPCANLIGFAGQELARKMPHVLGVLTETTIASIVEIILFMILLRNNQITLVKGAILGSILANMLLCLGFCFMASGVRRADATFDETISEAGSGLLLTAGVGLAVPAIYERSLSTSIEEGLITQSAIDANVLGISHAVAILLLISYFVFIWFQTATHHGLFTAVLEYDEERDHDRVKDMHKDKLTLTECIVALAVSVTLVTIIAVALVQEIPYIIEEHHVTDPFMGLILVPLVEKAAEHLTAIDEAWDNQMNFALIHCVGATLQTALLNTPLVVIVGWGYGQQMDLNFEIFDIAMLILAILTVGNFLRDQKTNYLEGFLCVVVYVAIAVAAFYYPSAQEEGSSGETTTEQLVARVMSTI